MVNSSQKEPRIRILDAAVSLFARKGFDAVGVRELAGAADVNISMISYYFGGKVGVLKAIISEFRDQYHKMIEQASDESSSPEEYLRALVCSMVDFARTNTDLSMIAFDSLPLRIPEIEDLRAEMMPELLGKADGLIKAFGLDPNDAVQMSIVGPALFTIVATHLRLKRSQERTFNTEFDDAFYERYAETLADLFLYGVAGTRAKTEGERRH
jgi:AcrR family transcriptional regulator